MKQKVLYLFLSLMLMSLSVSAQTGGGRIAGIVIDDSGEEPLPGATIFIEELKKGVAANGHGEFSFSDIPPATYTLTVKFMGYHAQTSKITVGKERGKKIIIRMKAQSQSLEEVIVMGKSEARKIREQAMPISVISMSQIQG
ncbi:carboxypeptidase-like regulatory domain-containing protein, partial [Porphyromonas gulae]|uniref:carboxypeptidase-like regulatory domain-containing protein n=2 Tax=Porphyromonadaceae TaxID=171551 RepID=UPI002431EC23